METNQIEQNTNLETTANEKQSENQQQNNNDDLVKLDEIKTFEKEYKDVQKEMKSLKKSCVKYFLNKYEIKSEVDMKKLNFANINDLEYSILKFCDEKNIQYKQKQKVNDVSVAQNVIKKRIFF